MLDTDAKGFWEPVLHDRFSERAWGAIWEIARDLRRGDSCDTDPASGFRLPHYSLAGNAGVALFFSYLHQIDPEGGHGDTALELVEKAIEEIGETFSSPELYSGFPGVAWVLEHLRPRLIDTDEGDPGREIALALKGFLDHPARRGGNYDLIGGLVGLGVYALERQPFPGGRECLERVVAHLAETAEHHPEGITWRTSPELITAEIRDRFPQGNFNLGVAHGVPGVVALLGEACAEGIGAHKLLEGTVSWLLSHKLPAGELSIFPYTAAPEMEPRPTRLAWCYGDLGIAAALLVAALRVGEPAWEREALEIARAAARRPFESTGVVDAGLCHGAAGNAHLFNRMYQASGDPLLAEAARLWYARALDLQRPGEGIAGFLSWGPDESGEMVWRSEPGFLVGAAGIGLALLAAVTPLEPAWDRLLLASAPQRSNALPQRS